MLNIYIYTKPYLVIMKKSSLFCLFLLPLVSFAQSNFKSGYILNLKGDTLHGFVNYKEWGHNPKDLDFKDEIGGKSKSYGLEDISHFAIDGYVSYYRYTVRISLNKIDIASPPALSDTSSTIETVFLKTIQKGDKITLFAYRDDLKERFYIKENNTLVPTELFYGVYQDPNGSNSVIDKNTFRVQLALFAQKYMVDAVKVISQTQQAAYKESDLANLSAKINGNAESKPVGMANKSPVRFFVGAAFISSTLNYSANGPYYDPQPAKASSPKIIAGLDVLTNPDIGHLIFRLEMGYSVNNFDIIDKPNPIYNVAAYDENIIKLKQNVISITPQIIYNVYNAETLKLFVDLGYGVNVVSYNTTKVTVVVQGKPTSSTSKIKNSSDLNGSYTTFQFKVGGVINKHLEVYGSYFPNAEITKSANYSTSLNSYQLGLNYCF
ncbi:hypothetical protein [Mucilaginibacter psychrotolerans]|uniref:Outer membrane protein beta-barrel domain-containing protein n=1 Tax=Mucilaginibacter psychrotolerans TaxID=1524096 RepID=A0A4Y8SFA1_9SPHI|nr:hypothetical protein [Mucilaginibacter psychrotolerans]TFF37310.1 hypothetical protein E2R66_12815 [Mucilaginibacter psychrotolerans]